MIKKIVYNLLKISACLLLCFITDMLMTTFQVNEIYHDKNNQLASFIRNWEQPKQGITLLVPIIDINSPERFDTAKNIISTYKVDYVLCNDSVPYPSEYLSNIPIIHMGMAVCTADFIQRVLWFNRESKRKNLKPFIKTVVFYCSETKLFRFKQMYSYLENMQPENERPDDYYVYEQQNSFADKAKYTVSQIIHAILPDSLFINHESLETTTFTYLYQHVKMSGTFCVIKQFCNAVSLNFVAMKYSYDNEGLIWYLLHFIGAYWLGMYLYFKISNYFLRKKLLEKNPQT